MNKLSILLFSLFLSQGLSAQVKAKPAPAVWAVNYGLVFKGGTSHIIQSVVPNSIADKSGFRANDTVWYVDSILVLDEMEDSFLMDYFHKTANPILSIRRSGSDTMMELNKDMATVQPTAVANSSTPATRAADAGDNPFSSLNTTSNADLARLRSKVNNNAPQSAATNSNGKYWSAETGLTDVNALTRELTAYLKTLEQKVGPAKRLIEGTNKRNYYIQSAKMDEMRNEVMVTLDGFITRFKNTNSESKIATLRQIKTQYEKFLQLPPYTDY